jgi:MFS family permease
MFGFTIVWIGQIVSVLASNMSGFALSIWMFEKTHSATAMGLMQVAFILPFLLLSPLAGVWVDRYNRKLMMMISDLGNIGHLGLILQATGHLHLASHVAMFSRLGNTFQWPAYSAATTMIPKSSTGALTV